MVGRCYCTDSERFTERKDDQNVVKKRNAKDTHLFREEIGDVVPLNVTPTIEPAKSDKPVRRRSKPFAPVSTRPTGHPAHPVEATQGTDEQDTHRKNGVQRRVIQKLKRGRFPIVDQLDLHSMTTRTAAIALEEFIGHSRDARIVCVRIIHGKGLRSTGAPRLKNMTRQALREHPAVLAFSPCKPGDGGEGAVDVLLKTR
jgi:DNA-nicking Smr family endonuclease